MTRVETWNKLLHRGVVTGDMPEGGWDLRNVDLRNVDLRGANLNEANLSGSNLEGVNLSLSRLSCSILRDANLKSANLYKATLTSADLRMANLQEANLEEAHLYETNLQNANLEKAVLKGAYLSGTNFEGTVHTNYRDDLSAIDSLKRLAFYIVLIGVITGISYFVSASYGGKAGLIASSAWFFLFFLSGLKIHNIFYASVFPFDLSERFHSNHAVLTSKIIWFLQVPLAGFNAINPMHSIVVTQSIIFILSVSTFLLFLIAARNNAVGSKIDNLLNRPAKIIPSYKRRDWGGIFTATALGILFLYLGHGLTIGISTEYIKSYQSVEWPETIGEVTSSTVMRAGDGDWYPGVRYAYFVGSSEYEGKHISLIGIKHFFFASTAEEILQRKYPKGESVFVYYDPNDPVWSVLEPRRPEKLDWFLFGVAIVFGIFFVYAGLVGIIGSLFELVRPGFIRAKSQE